MAFHPETLTLVDARVNRIMKAGCMWLSVASSERGRRPAVGGVCAQPCRSRRILPGLVASGVTSFKIEGRYKEIDYVKNVTAAYSRRLDEFIRSHGGYRRSSSGRSEYSFSPDVSKTFNRGFTRYFIGGRKEKVASMDTPKSLGEPAGIITSVGKGFFSADCPDLRSGDGLCFFAKARNPCGFRIERGENRRIFPSSMKDLSAGLQLHRNHNNALSRALNKDSRRRRIDVTMEFRHDNDHARLVARDEDGVSMESVFAMSFEAPRNLRLARELVEKHLSSAGDTPFKVIGVIISSRSDFYP